MPIIMLLALLFLYQTQVAEANEATRSKYLALIQEYPHLITPQGDAKKGEIQIILDPEQMSSIEQKTGRDVGLIARDKYWLWINDACRFPSGQEGVYGRILWVKSLSGTAGVVVLPILPDGKIALICTFRHATRSWEMELPRGCVENGEMIEKAAAREVREETGLLVDHLQLMGVMPPDTGLTGSEAFVYAARVKEVRSAQPEYSEAIEQVYTLTVEEIKDAFFLGSFSCKIKGQHVLVAFRDPFLAYALLLYEKYAKYF
jgi:ADP-ribose pyrophosphatase